VLIFNVTLHEAIFSTMCTQNPLATEVLKGKTFSAMGQQTGFLEGITKKIDDRYVTRNNLSRIHDLTLQVFEAGLSLKIVRCNFTLTLLTMLIKTNINIHQAPF